MEAYRPSAEVLASAGFHRSPAPGEWCNAKRGRPNVERAHMHYMEADHSIEVYNDLPHPRFALTSQDDAAFQAEVQELVATQPAYSSDRRRCSDNG